MLNEFPISVVIFKYFKGYYRRFDNDTVWKAVQFGQYRSTLQMFYSKYHWSSSVLSYVYVTIKTVF